MNSDNPAGWPEELVPVFERALTCEYASLTAKGAPITWPMNPYVGEDRRTLNVSTGLTYAAKADRARKNPRVALLFSDPVGSGIERMPMALVHGMATIRDRDLQAGADRYITLAFSKYPAAYAGTPGFLLRRQQWYFTRAWILVTPVKIMWWEAGRWDEPPREWQAPEGTTAPESDPPPQGPPLGPWQQHPDDWRAVAENAVRDLGRPVITVVGQDGWPYLLRTNGARMEGDGIALDVAKGLPVPLSGPACLTFHVHAEVFAGQQNTTLIGQAERREGGAFFRVEKAMPDFSLPGNRLQSTLALMSAARKLTPRLRAEVARRGQNVPEIRLPGKEK